MATPPIPSGLLRVSQNTTRLPEATIPHVSQAAQSLPSDEYNITLRDFLALVKDYQGAMSKPSLLDTFDNIGLALISTGAAEHMGVLALASTVDPAAKRRIKDLFDEGLNPRAPVS